MVILSAPTNATSLLVKFLIQSIYKFFFILGNHYLLVEYALYEQITLSKFRPFCAFFLQVHFNRQSISTGYNIIFTCVISVLYTGHTLEIQGSVRYWPEKALSYGKTALFLKKKGLKKFTPTPLLNPFPKYFKPQ